MRPARLRRWLLPLLMCTAGVSGLSLATDGWRAFTAEGARRVAVAERPRPLPAAQLQDQTGRRFTLEDLRGRVVVVDFIYTRCATVCRALGSSLERLQRALPPAALGDEVVLLSVSFDPAFDTPERLRAYAERHRADERTWHVARVADPAELQALLATFEVQVLPDPYGGYEHNAALHVVDRHQRLRAILDYEAPEATARAVEALL